MLPKDIRRIMEENKKYADMLEYYDDRTGRFSLDKARKNFTLKEINAARLENEAKESGKSMSEILDELIEKGLASRA